MRREGEDRPADNPTTGYLMLNGWHGVSRQKVEIVGETPKKYRIRAIEKTRLAGRCRWLNPGEVTLVPKHAVRDNCDFCEGAKGGVPGNENVIPGNKSGWPANPDRRICDYCDAERRTR